jgi:hypothetical protein
MHRSGTSSLAGLVSCLGVPIGEDLLEANDWNPRGYAELRRVVEIHDRFLATLGLRWDSARAPMEWEGDAALEARAALRATLSDEFSGRPLFAVKDPRMCRLLPLWRPVLAALGASPSHVIVLRHPLEVAASLERRDGLTRSRCHLLWVQHLLAAERETRGTPRSFVSYDELMGDWRGVAKRLAGDLGLAWPRDPEAAAGEVEDFLSNDLRHHRAEPSWPPGEADAFPWTVAVHEDLAALAAHGESPGRHAALDAHWATLAAAAALYDPELETREAELTASEARAEDLDRQRRKALRQRDRLIASPWLWLRSFLGRLRHRIRG